jgi:hypothetical protein
MTTAQLQSPSADSRTTAPRAQDRRPSPLRWALSGAAATGVAAWVLWRTRPGEVPNLGGFAAVAADWPSATIDSGFAYTLRVPLGQIIYRVLPNQDPAAFFALHAACLVFVAALLMAWLFRRLGAQRGLLAGCVIALAPITPVLLLWIGMYDAFSMLAWVIVLMSFTRGPRLQFSAATLAGFQNFEQSMVGLVLVLLLPALSRGAELAPRAIPLLAGAASGKALLECVLAQAGAAPGTRTTYLIDDNKALQLLGSAFTAVPVLIWSALGGMWIFALLALRVVHRTWGRRHKAMLTTAAVVWLASGALAEDQTRVLALTSFPAIVLGAIMIASRHRDLFSFPRSPAGWMLTLAPPLVLWNNELLPFRNDSTE